MQAAQANGRLVISFDTPHEGHHSAFQRALDRFASHDDRWRAVLEMAGGGLSEKGCDTFAAALDLLEAGPAPLLLPFSIEPDDESRFRREGAQMEDKTLLAIGLLIPTRLGFGHPEIATVERLITAVHRLLRIAKARP